MRVKNKTGSPLGLTIPKDDGSDCPEPGIKVARLLLIDLPLALA